MTAVALQTVAPGKTNYGLFVGPTAANGLHTLATVIAPLSVADRLTLAPHPEQLGGDVGPTVDEVDCPGVAGPNLAAAAMAAYRAASGWRGPRQLLTIAKRVPVAAGMGGGSSDAAAALRLIAAAAGRPDDPLIAALAPQLGSDVPSQLRPQPVLVSGTGGQVDPLPPLPPHAVAVIPLSAPLTAGAVFAAADRLGAPRPAAELAALRAELAEVHGTPGRRRSIPRSLLANDLAPAAQSLCPEIGAALRAVAAAGADDRLLSGSGPTVIGLFWGGAGRRRAAGAVAALADRYPAAFVAEPVGADIAAVTPVRDNGAL